MCVRGSGSGARVSAHEGGRRHVGGARKGAHRREGLAGGPTRGPGQQRRGRGERGHAEKSKGFKE